MNFGRFANLRYHALLATLDDEQFSRVTHVSQLIELSAEQMLFQRGDPAQHFYVVIEGRIKLCLQSRGGDEKIVDVRSPGQTFAEALMFSASPAFPVAAVAMEPSTVAAVSSAEYLAVLRGSTEMCFKLLADLSQRLHGLMREIETLALENSTNRVVNHLLRMAGTVSGATTVTLGGTKQALAARLAIKPETLSRIFRSLTDAGILRVDGPHIYIADVGRLREER